MAARKITLHCDVPVRDILCAAIRDYAHAAYPEGGSDCAQVARYTLLELAGLVEAAISDTCHSVEISKRPRAMLKAAIDYHFDRQDAALGSTSIHQRALVQGLLQAQPATAPDLEAAVAADRVAPG
jgi:hypothetical protein